MSAASGGQSPLLSEGEPTVSAFYDQPTGSFTYIAACPATGRCAVIDPVLCFDPVSGRTSRVGVDGVIEAVRSGGLTVDWIIETHVHADHITAAPMVREALGGRIAIADRVRGVQARFASMFGEEAEGVVAREQFDHFFAPDDTFTVGALAGRCFAAPGHTPACTVYVIGDAAFVGDVIFQPDMGTGRCDFPGGDAAAMFASIQRLYAMPDTTRVFVGHDYPESAGRSAPRAETTVGEEKRANKHVRGDTSMETFVRMRTERDAQLSLPRLIIPSVQVNIAGGFAPGHGAAGQFVRIPVDVL